MHHQGAIMKYNITFLDTYKKYIQKGWYDGVISSPNLERWIENFSEDTSIEGFDPLICAHFLINSLILYQDKQLGAIIINIENKIKSKINEEKEQKAGHRLSEAQLESFWENYKQECCIIAAASPEATGDSAHHASRLWRNTTGIKTVSISQLVEEIVKFNKRHIIFADDFIGTGTKMHTFLTKNLFPDRKYYGFINVREVINAYSTSVDFSISTFGCCEVGFNKISKEFPSVSFYYGDFYDAEYDLLSKNCVLYDAFLDNRDNIISYLSNKNRELDGTNPYALNLPVAFHHGCPNNSLSLYYKSIPNWAALLPEGHPKQT